MIDPKQIPDEVVGKVKTLMDEMGFFLAPPLCDFEAREIAVAVLAAWPGVEHQTPDGWSNKPHIILPMPQEASDECL